MAIFHMFPLASPWMTMHTLRIAGHKEKASGSVLIGARGVGKTCLLFQSAVTHAAENKTVTFICRQPLSQLPLSVHGMPAPDPATLQHVKFIYLSEVGELVDWCANIHKLSCLTDVLIVDDVDVYASGIKDRNLEHATSTVLALITDAVDFIRQKSGDCSLLISATDRSKSLHSVYRQFDLTSVFVQREITATDTELTVWTELKNSSKLCVCCTFEQSHIMVINIQMKEPS